MAKGKLDAERYVPSEEIGSVSCLITSLMSVPIAEAKPSVDLSRNAAQNVTT